MEYKNQLDLRYSKICETCGKEFFKKKCEGVIRWNERRFCGWDCRRYGHYKCLSRGNKYPNTEFYSRCLQCGEMLEIRFEYEFLKKKFCSVSCSKKYDNPSKNSWSKERRKKLSLKMKKKAENGTWKNPIKFPGVIDKIKETKNKNKVPFSKERLELQSRLCAERIINGKNENLGCVKYGNIGYFFSKKNEKDIRYRSSFELKAMEIFEWDKEILSYKNEPFYIPYKIDGIKRCYIPDFLVEYSNGENKLIEVKPLCKLSSKKTILKEKAALKYCRENNINAYEIWTEVVLFPHRKII